MKVGLNMKYPETKEKLNELVINLLHMHMIVRRHHWYMRGSQFLKLHPYLNDLMDELDDQIDGLAERLITIDGSPVATLREVVQLNKIPGEKGSWDFTNTQRLEKIISGYRYLDKLYEEALEASDKEGDYSTNDILTGFHTDLEKRLWMLTAELGQAPDIDA